VNKWRPRLKNKAKIHFMKSLNWVHSSNLCIDCAEILKPVCSYSNALYEKRRSATIERYGKLSQGESPWGRPGWGQFVGGCAERNGSVSSELAEDVTSASNPGQSEFERSQLTGSRSQGG
jgi:hypothetical protein